MINCGEIRWWVISGPFGPFVKQHFSYIMTNVGYHYKLCAMEPRLRLKRFRPREGWNPETRLVSQRLMSNLMSYRGSCKVSSSE